MPQTRQTSVATGVLLMVGFPVFHCAIAVFINNSTLAQSSTTPVIPRTTAGPQGTTVQIDGSSSMKAANEALKQRFETLATEPTPETASAPATEQQKIPWWWWLSIPLLGGLIWWLIRNRQTPPAPVVPLTPVAPPAPVVPPVTGVRDTFTESTVKAGGVDTLNAKSTAIANSEDTLTKDSRIVETIPTGTVIGSTLAGTETTSQSDLYPSKAKHNSRIILVHRHSHEAYAYWELLDEDKYAARQQGGQKLTLLIYDVTNIDLKHQQPDKVLQFDCDELDRDLHVSVPESGDYVAEVGYVTEDGLWWLKLATSEPVHIPA